MQFKEMMERLDALRRAHAAGAPVEVEMQSLAREAAAQYNAQAAEIARRFNRKAKTVTAASILRSPAAQLRRPA